VRIILGSLPFLATFLWSLVFYFRIPSNTRSWRWSLALSCITLGTFTLVITEALSAAHLLHQAPVLTMWIGASLSPLLILWPLREVIDTATEISRLRIKLLALPIWLLLTITCTFLLIIIMAVVTPPMNFDVQIYHMPRQIFWMMQGSVASFASSNPHQISMPVLSEYLGLNLLLLSNGDAWHNLIQALFMAASCGIVSVMVSILGGRARAQGLAVITVLLVPVAFLEASNSKNDIVLSFFTLVPLFTGLRVWCDCRRPTIPLLLLASLSAGLALSTKGTAIAYLPASALLIIAACIRAGAVRTLLLAFVPALLLSILPAVPQLTRNMQIFHSPAGPNLHHTNQRHDPLSIVSVALRNTVGQFTCGSESWNTQLELGTRNLLLRMGIDPDDPATTFDGQIFHLPYFAGLEDIVPAPVQTALILLLPFGFLIPSFRCRKGVIVLFLTVIGSLLLFSLIFPWQPWQGRLLIPSYFMAAPLIGLLLDFLKPKWLPIAITLLELLSLRPHLLFAGQRPLLGGASIFHMIKDAQLSRMMPGRAEEIDRLAEHISQLGAQSIMVDGGSTEIYGLLRGIHKALPLVTLISGRSSNPPSCDLIVMPSVPYAGVAPPPAGSKPSCPLGFRPVWHGDYYWIFDPIPIE
jgi:hypothetical protein